MFRAATKGRLVQRAASLSRPKTAVPLSSIHYGSFGVSSADDDTTSERVSYHQPQLISIPTIQAPRGGRFSGNCTTFNLNNSRRGFATSAGNDSSDTSAVDSTLDRLFRENEVVKGDATAEPWVDGAQSVANSGMEFVPTWYNPADWCIEAILKVQELTGAELGMAIVGTTLAVRVMLFPVVASGQKAASRMAHLSPELKQLQAKYENVRNASLEQKQKMGEEMKALFKRYETNPFKSMTAPLIQLPVMMGMFFGLKKMPTYFPEEMATGGMYWFTNLAVPDPNYILPGICFITFVGTVELGKEQMMASSPDSGANMLMFMRGLSLLMGYVCTTFDAGLVLYFTVTNVFTVVQMGVLKVPAVKKYFGIWDPPKPIPGQVTPGLFEQGKKLIDRAQGKVVDENAKLRQHNEMVEAQKKMQEMSKRRRERRRASLRKK